MMEEVRRYITYLDFRGVMLVRVRMRNNWRITLIRKMPMGTG